MVLCCYFIVKDVKPCEQLYDSEAQKYTVNFGDSPRQVTQKLGVLKHVKARIGEIGILNTGCAFADYAGGRQVKSTRPFQ
jgi:hypothetical protein